MKLAIATIFYNCKPELERLLNSIPDKAIDYFIAIDGAFQYFDKHDNKIPSLSTDGSRQLILSDTITPKITNIATISRVNTMQQNLINVIGI